MLEKFLSLSLNLPVILLADCLEPEQVINAARLGVREILVGPFSNERVGQALERHRVSLYHTSALQTVDRKPCPTILGDSDAMYEVYCQLGIAASNELNILITGETGVGKDVSAACIHRHSERANAPFVAINCTAVPDGLLESEFFGHVRGAYTSAAADARGKVESAEGGCLLLDEIGDMPLHFQAKLLRFLENKTYYRVGDSTQRKADVRVIASTNRDLEEEIRAGRFRRDLYFRLAQLPIHIPPLRARREDILALAQAFIAEANLQMNLAVAGLAHSVEQALLRQDWPGNVRELKNVIGQAVAATRNGLIEQLPAGANGEVQQQGDSQDSSSGLEQIVRQAITRGEIRELFERVERITLSTMLDVLQGNRSRISEELGVSRNTLRTKLRDHGLQ